MKTSDKILEYLAKNNQATVNELVDYLKLSRMAVSKQLKKLINEGEVYKVGKPPKVFYFLKEIDKIDSKEKLDKKTADFIEANYLFITSSGERKQGLDGFRHWCQANSLPLGKTSKEYLKTLKKYQALKKEGYINGMEKFEKAFEEVDLDKIFYLDFYSIERFGKTKLGQLLLYAKQSQSKELMRELADYVCGPVNKLIKRENIDAVGFIPPTVKREVQFMKELEKNLHLNLKKISIIKLKTEIPVPQKTLNKIKDREENARKTIIVDEKGKYNKVLLIDDAAGSGATLNETAGKIKRKGVAKKVLGISITGSFEGFDVISEV